MVGAQLECEAAVIHLWEWAEEEARVEEEIA
eukprot:COSAG02_NODE_60563_length_271_cov_0.593023_1_plen_30_part_01